MIDGYLTIAERSEGLYKEKGSKFIGIAIPCYSEEEAKFYLGEWRKEHHQARHLCYAYRFGIKGEMWRANDDGEPGNSAGAPILGQIDSFELTNVLIGVVRYYGGTKLGVGGLINAYRTAAKEALSAAHIVKKEVRNWFKITFEYPDMVEVMNRLNKIDIEIKEKEFDVNCVMVIGVPVESLIDLEKELDEFKTVNIATLGCY